MNTGLTEIGHELRETLNRSKQIAISLEKHNQNTFTFSKRMRPITRKRMRDMTKVINNLNRTLQIGDEDSPVEFGQDAMLNLSAIHQITNTKAQKHEGKRFLLNSIRQVNHRVLMSRAGKDTFQGYIKQKNFQPLFLREMRSNKDTSRTSNTQPDTLRCLSTHANRRNLVQVNHANGKVMEPTFLPSFQQFCETENLNFNANAYNKRLSKEADKVQEILENFREELDGLSIYCNQNLGVPWNGDRDILKRLYRSPSKKQEIIESYLEQMQSRERVQLINRRDGLFAGILQLGKGMNVLGNIIRNITGYNRRSRSHTQKQSQAQTSARSKHHSQLPYISFNDIKDSQENKLKQIVQRVDADRPFTVKEKFRHYAQDTERFRDANSTITRFRKVSHQVEEARFNQNKKNSKQVILYKQMLQHVKDSLRTPTENDLFLIELVRLLIEDQWIIDKEVFFDICEYFQDEDIMESGLWNLLGKIRTYLDISKEELFEWMRKRYIQQIKWENLTYGINGVPQG